MRDVCLAGIDKNLTSNSAPNVSLFSSVVEYQTVNQRITASIQVSDSGCFLSIQLEEHFLSNFIITKMELQSKQNHLKNRIVNQNVTIGHIEGADARRMSSGKR